LPDKGETLDALDVVQGTAKDKVVGVGRGTHRSPRHLSCLLASQTNVEDFVDAMCRCNLVNWESIAGSPLQIIPNWNNLGNIIQLLLKLDLPDEGKTLDALDMVQGMAKDKVVGVGRGTR
jgi:hypothetical protein